MWEKLKLEAYYPLHGIQLLKDGLKILVAALLRRIDALASV